MHVPYARECITESFAAASPRENMAATGKHTTMKSVKSSSSAAAPRLRGGAFSDSIARRTASGCAQNSTT